MGRVLPVCDTQKRITVPLVLRPRVHRQDGGDVELAAHCEMDANKLSS
jgi:hypothetical protein